MTLVAELTIPLESEQLYGYSNLQTDTFISGDISYVTLSSSLAAGNYLYINLIYLLF